MKALIFSTMVLAASACTAQTVTKLPAPDMQRNTLTVMETFRQRHSERTFSEQPFSDQELSELLWAAQGKNRDDGHITSPTAMNRQEIRLYVFSAQGVSLYNPQNNTLTNVASGDHRNIVAGRQEAVKTAPIMLVMVADMDKFGSNDDRAKTMVAVDAGIVSQNINIFCSAAGYATVPRATMDEAAIRQLLGLSVNQIPLLNNPIGKSVKQE